MFCGMKTVEEKEIKKLKPHRVLESVAGDDAWYTYIPFTNNEKLYYICDGKIKTLKITRQEFINFRLLTMGLSVNTEKMNSKSNLSELLKMKDVVKFLNLLHSKS